MDEKCSLLLLSQKNKTLLIGCCSIMLGIEAEVGEKEVVQACKDANIYDFIVSFPFLL
jgi:hypothetical protein